MRTASSVTLNPVEQRLARDLAESRHAANRSRGVADRKVGPQGAWETDLEGVAAEIALCRILNAYPDTSVGHRPDFDLRVSPPELPGRELTVDAKATRYPGGRLLAVLRKAAKPPDVYALLVGTFPTYRLAGFAPSALLLREANVEDLGHGPTFCLPQWRLLSWRDVLDIFLEIPFGGF